MVAVDVAAPVAFGLFSLAFLYIAYRQRREDKISWFELMFLMSLLAISGTLFMVYSGLDFAGDSFASTVFPFFAMLLWIFVLMFMIVVFKFIKYWYYSMREAIRTWNKKKPVR